MELTLNLVWALLAILLVKLWMQHTMPSSAHVQTQIVALLMVIVILFPVISVTDDLQIAQNPAEADSYYLCTRRDHDAVSPHSIFPAPAMLPPLVFAETSLGFFHIASLGTHSSLRIEIPALASIQNRPPPAA